MSNSLSDEEIEKILGVGEETETKRPVAGKLDHSHGIVPKYIGEYADDPSAF